MQRSSVASAEFECSAKEPQLAGRQRVAVLDEEGSAPSQSPGMLPLAFDDSIKEMLVQYLDRLE